MKNRIIELSNHEFVRVSGSDAVSFLQGQITANLDNLSADNCVSAALCNLKGRVIADFRVILRDDDCILQTSKGMAGIIISTLAKYAVFSKVEISHEQDIVARGIMMASDQAGPNVDGFDSFPARSNQCLQNSDALLLKLECAGMDKSGDASKHRADQRFELWQFHNSVCAVENSGAGSPESDLSDWQRGDILSGTVHVDQSISERYTPQLLNYDISGVVDFDKGCYTGQEVVARMHYRGKAKKRLFLLRLKETGITVPCERTISLGEGFEQTEVEILSAVSTAETDNDSTKSLVLAVMATGVSTAGEAAEASIIELAYSK